MDINELCKIRHTLHQHPELSLCENWTNAHLLSWLRRHTSLEVRSLERGILAIKEPTRSMSAILNAAPAPAAAPTSAAASAPAVPSIAFRADYDALPIREDNCLPYHSVNEGVSHKCGHDGHTAALCGLALALEKMETDRRILLIFQGAEEIGQGGESCAEALEEYNVREIYAFHNRSGYPENAVIIKNGVTQCASEGLTITFEGRASHASAPENGLNPSAAAAELVLSLQEIQKRNWDGLVMATVVHVQVGSPDFGISPGSGLVSVTLRAEIEQEMKSAEEMVHRTARYLAAKYGLQTSVNRQDVFPETANWDICSEKVASAAEKLGLRLIRTKDVWRASEDFGHYTKKFPGAMFYIGNGENYPALHTVDYDFNDKILETAMQMFLALAECDPVSDPPEAFNL